MQAIIDCYTLSKRTEDQIARKDAVSWFSLINKEFIKVCSYADLEPDYVMKKAKQAMQKSCSWRKDVHKEKRLSEINKDEFEAEVVYLNPNLFKKTAV